jgi:hypothetical protein
MLNHRSVSLSASAALTIITVVAAGHSALAFEPRFNWIGSAVITAASPACSGKWDVGNRLYSVYRPKLQATEDNSAISFEGFGPAGIFTTTSNTSQLGGAGNYTSASWGFSHTRPANSNGTYNFTLSPATIKTTTNFVTITGSISNFFANPSCNIQFRGAYTLKP